MQTQINCSEVPILEEALFWHGVWVGGRLYCDVRALLKEMQAPEYPAFTQDGWPVLGTYEPVRSEISQEMPTARDDQSK